MAPVEPRLPGSTSRHADEVARGERFEFGRNWASFLDTIDEPRIQLAVEGLTRMLGVQSLAGLRFLDVGSGSGLSSLAAHRLGATVVSFDFDPASVACTNELRRRFGGNASAWEVSEGSVLDRGFLGELGTFDVVYSWGVLHHTGAMWDALDAIHDNVADDGELFVALYNDQGAWSRRWRAIKRFYCSGTTGKVLTASTIIPYWVLRDFAADLVWMRPPFARYREYRQRRGMSVLHDWIDWLGGYPFEVARPEEVVEFYLARGFTLKKLRTVGGAVGCNEFVFRRNQRGA